MKKALIMEGGAMRGMFTCGVIDVFLENNITFEGGAGVSAGAVFGCNFKSRQIGRAIRYNKKYAGDSRYGSMKSFFKTGNIFDPEFAYHELPDKLDVFDRKTFKQNPMEFWLGAINVETGEEEYHKCTDGEAEDIEWMRASASIPVLSTIVEINGKKYLDGGTGAPVPYHLMMDDLHYEKSVVILTQPKGFIKKNSKSFIFIKLALHKYPKMVQALLNRPVLYNELYAEIEDDAEKGRTFVIRPDAPLNIKSTCSDPNEMERVYQEGRKTAIRLLPDIKKYLEIE